MIFVVLLLILIVLGLVQYISHVQCMEEYLKDLQTLPRMPLIGNVKFFLGKSLQQMYEELNGILLEKGTPFKIQMGPAYFVVVDHPDDMKTILTSPHCLDRPYIYDFIYLPNSILTQRVGKLWKPTRKLVNPMFKLKKLQSFLPIFNEKAALFVQKLEVEVNKPQFDLYPYSNSCTMDSLCSTIMGINLAEQPNKGLNFLSSVEGIYDSLTKRFATPWLHPEFIYQWTKLYEKQHKGLKTLRDLTNRVINTKTDHYLQKQNANVNNNNMKNVENESVDLLSKFDFPFITLSAEGKLNKEIAEENIDVLLVAGHETTATTIAFAVLLLAMHPDIQDQVFDELHSVYETHDQETTYDLMQKLDLLDRVIKETMRLFPSVFAFLRCPTVDIQLRNCVIPKGVVIGLPVYTLHRRRDFWGENAEQFNPDHFLPENTRNRHQYAYLPFSGGPRNCIGFQYGVFTVKVMLSALLRKYKFSTDLILSELRPGFEVTLKLTNKYMMKIERRNW